MRGEKQKVIFMDQEYTSIQKLAEKLGKTHNQMYSHLKKGTPVIGHEPHCVDLKLTLEDWNNKLNQN